MKDLGYKESHDGMAVPAPKSEKRMCYPTLTIRDKSLEMAFGKELPAVGDMIEATLTLKVTGVSDQKWGKNVEFEVHAGEFGEPEEGGESEGEDEYEKD